MITASIEDLFRQATMTADHYLAEAVHNIDERFGEGYAVKNPGLVAAYVQAAGQDYTASLLAKTVQRLADAIIEHGAEY